MVRKLKHHEQKLLRKTHLTSYPPSTSSSTASTSTVLRRYLISAPSDYTSYNRLCGSLRSLAHKLSLLAPSDPFRSKYERLLLEKLYDMGITSTKGGRLSEVEKKISVSAVCRRRLAVVLTRLQMADTMAAAVRFVEQGHVRVGTEVVTDPGFLVGRNLEDFVTWVEGSRIRRNVLRYRDKLDDFDLL